MHADPGWWSHAWFWLEVHLGIEDVSGPWYAFWSGFGSDISEIAILGAIAAFIHHHNCQVKGCLRPGLHPVVGTPYKTCKTHHPTIDHTERVTADTVLASRNRAHPDDQREKTAGT